MHTPKTEFEGLPADDLDQHIMENMMFDRDAASPILTGHLLIEQILEVILSRSLKDFRRLADKHRMGFDFKVDLATSLGLITEKHHSAFKALNNIRNNLAHSYEYQVDLSSLNSLKFDWEPIQEKAYKVSCTRGVDDAARIAVMFLCWKAQQLINIQAEQGAPSNGG
jgi:hypothetical protein